MELFINNYPQSDRFFDIEEGWVSPGPPNMKKFFWFSQVVATFISIPLFTVFFLVLGEGALKRDLEFGFYLIPCLILVIILVSAVHEWVHYIALPKSRRWYHTAIIVIPKYAVIGVYYRGIISRNRMLLMLIAPFIFLTLFLFPFGLYVKSSFITFAAIWNGAASTFDLINAYGLIKSIPRDSWIRGYNNQVYYKLIVRS